MQRYFLWHADKRKGYGLQKANNGGFQFLDREYAINVTGRAVYLNTVDAFSGQSQGKQQTKELPKTISGLQGRLWEHMYDLDS